MWMRALSAVCLIFPLVTFAPPQPAEQAVTNADVAAMLKAGLSESTIVSAIDLAAERGTTRFDVSAQALIALKDQGATTGVLDAMLRAARMPQRPLPSTTVKGLPTGEGAYYKTPSGFTAIAPVTLWPEVDLNWRGLTSVEERRYVLTGERASFRISDARPVFFTRTPYEARNWQMVRLSTAKDTREWRTVPTELPRLTEPLEPLPENAVHVEITPMAYDVVRIRPLSPLAPGEYALVSMTPAQRWLANVYPFAVTGAQAR